MRVIVSFKIIASSSSWYDDDACGDIEKKKAFIRRLLHIHNIQPILLVEQMMAELILLFFAMKQTNVRKIEMPMMNVTETKT